MMLWFTRSRYHTPSVVPQARTHNPAVAGCRCPPGIGLEVRSMSLWEKIQVLNLEPETASEREASCNQKSPNLLGTSCECEQCIDTANYEGIRWRKAAVLMINCLLFQEPAICYSNVSLITSHLRSSPSKAVARVLLSLDVGSTDSTKFLWEVDLGLSCHDHISRWCRGYLPIARAWRL